MNGPFLQGLDQCQDKALSGMKAVNLGRLIRGGFAAPGGFVITTDAYRRARSSPPGPMPRDLADSIRLAYAELGRPLVAVRSSATAEDLAGASMAGQYETILNVQGEQAVLEAVQRRCWAGLDSPRTRAYLDEHGIDLSAVAMAVIVQRLVPSDVSGVLFTADPKTGDTAQMVLEASWGLGEAIVSGLVQPDVLHLDAATGEVLESTVSDKKVFIPPGSHEALAVDEPRRRLPCLPPPHVRALWDLGRKAAEYFGCPQDIEWAIADGHAFLLQSRPITTLEHAEVYQKVLASTREDLCQALQAVGGPFVLHNLAETLPHPTPLTWSIIRPFMSGSGGFGELYRQAGYRPSAKVAQGGFLRLVAGRIYMDVSLAGEMFLADFPFRYSVQALREDPEAAQSPPTLPAGSLRKRMRARRRIAAAGKQLRRLAADLDRTLRERTIPKFVAWCRQEKQRDLAACSSRELTDLWCARQQRVLDEFAPQSLLPSLVGAMALEDLRAFLAESFWDLREDLDELASRLSVPPGADQTLEGSAALFRLAQGTMTAEEWLERHGHRAVQEFDLASPRWREQKADVEAMARRLQDGPDPMDLHRRRVEDLRLQVQRLQDRLSEPLRREFARRLDLVWRYMIFREDGKHYLMLGYDLLRDLAVESGRRLGIGDGVFMLRRDELFDALRDSAAPADRIARRKSEYRAEARLFLPPFIDEPALETLGQPPALDSAAGYPAMAVSAGTASGPAWIVHRPQEAAGRGKGYVLVCTSTDPAWTPLFVNAGALVLECGGTLSHGAVVAREMGIPAIVLPRATTLFAQGEQLTVDGNRGAVIRTAEAANVSLAGLAADKDARVEGRLKPPPPGPIARRAGRLRNFFLLFWGVYLAAALLLPQRWLYDPSFALLDRVLWPLALAVGKPLMVAILASALAVLTMVGQRWLTDNRRLREAKRRSALLVRKANRLDPASPRRAELLRLATPAQGRLMMAAFVPLAMILGPMIMTFLYLPARVDVDSWSPPPGADVDIVAVVRSDCREPVRIEAPPPLQLDETFPASRTLPPIRQTLEKLLARLERPADPASGPAPFIGPTSVPASQPDPFSVPGPANPPAPASEPSPAGQGAASDAAGEEIPPHKVAELREFLAAGVPPQPLGWTLHSPPASGGRFPVRVYCGRQEPVEAWVVLGPQDAPAPREVQAAGPGDLLSVRVVYPRQQGKVFWAPLAFLARLEPATAGVKFLHGAVVAMSHWDAGWLVTYLLAYLPVMFLTRWMLRVA